ncbi:MAG: P-loop NTPase fold protein [Egibacteraceae bacterium]
MPAELSGPSQLAFRWAWARAGGAAPGASAVGSLDLLVGILLAHVADSEPRQLLDHFGVPLGAVLGAAGARRYDGDGLLAAVRRLPADALPPLEPDVERILARAREAPDPDGLVPLRALFGALLELDNPASAAIRRELAARGIDAAAIVASYHDFLASQQPYGTFLRDRHPCPPPRVEVPAYQADKPLAEPDDLVGISAEVDAFAYLIASRALAPPLAIGLFGDWGSGKSFFLRSLQRRIDGLVNAPAASRRVQRELPFYTHIVQIEFNAWQYVEGNLWASLVEHVFRNLRTCADDDLVAQRQDHWIERLKVTDERREQLHAQRDRLEQQRQTAAEEVQRIRAKPLAALIERAKHLVRSAGLPMAAEAQELRAALTEARDVLHQANPLLEPLRRGGWRSAAVVVMAVALTPAVIWALGQLDVSGALETAAILASVLASAAAYLRRGTRVVQDGLTEIAQAQEQLDKVEAQLDAATAKERELAEEAERVEAELAGTTPASVLAEFLAERTGSDDYRRHLGVPALIRRDLERLSNLVEQQNRRLEDGQAPPTSEYPINRIVLYIDDLDRCPTELVIQVLQAVHLLLAFPLFVVVVAVDARWLAGSLREHYGRLLSDGESATPDDYLEKIFQVPFWVQPLGAETRRRLVRGLLTPSLAAGAPMPAASGEAPAPGPIEEVDPGFFALVDALFDTEAPNPAWLEAARLEITEQELALIDEVAPLLGDTPRSVKRFANVYQLMKSMRRSQRQPADGAVILLLAVATGLPGLARTLLGTVERHHTGPFALDEVLKDLADPALAVQHRQLSDWLDQHPDCKTLDTPDLPDWTALIRRFSFRLEHVL